MTTSGREGFRHERLQSAAFCLSLSRPLKVSDTRAHKSLDLQRSLVGKSIAQKPGAWQCQQLRETLPYSSLLACSIAREVGPRELPSYDDFYVRVLACTSSDSSFVKASRAVAISVAPTASNASENVRMAAAPYR